jgi:hypothetical protein
MRLRNRSRGGSRSRLLRPVAGVSVAAVVALVAAGCGSSSPSSGTGSASSGSNTIPKGLSISSFTVNLETTMSKLKPLAQFATKGANTLQVGVILPDTTSSVRWVDFDQPTLLLTPASRRRSTGSTTRREATRRS